MMAHDVRALLTDLPVLRISASTNEDDAMGAMRSLGEFDGSMVGAVRFEGDTPWEWHPTDELLVVFEGSVRLTVLEDGGPLEATLRAGSVAVVPARRWHRQSSPRAGVLFVTPPGGRTRPLGEGPPGPE
jgi:quercetin dioxygenase-like cupin family protein